MFAHNAATSRMIEVLRINSTRVGTGPTVIRLALEIKLIRAEQSSFTVSDLEINITNLSFQVNGLPNSSKLILYTLISIH
jgi:hypothetical protein